MKAIVNTAAGRLEMQDLPLPEPGRGQVRVRTSACAICATDLDMIDGWERTGFPSIPGHEWAGVVDAVGPEADPDLLGRPCVAENVLADGGEVGFEHPGGYGEYFLTEAEKVCVLPEAFEAATATMIEPLAVCVRGVGRLGADASGPVLILGDGPVGLLMLMLLARQGLRPIVMVGGRQRRLALAKQVGAQAVLNYQDLGDELPAALARQAAGGFETVIEASGAPEAMSIALQLAKCCARMLILGDYGGGTGRLPVE